MKKPVGVEVEDKSAEKPEEEGLTFNEWAQKVLAEEEKEKHHGKYEGESIKNQPNLLLGEIDLFFFDVIAL